MFLSKTRLSSRPKTALVSVGLCSNPDAVVVKVTDTGIGIDLPHVLDRSYRADKVRSRDLGGTGLGLSIAKWIAEKNGGSIRVESVVGTARSSKSGYRN